MCVNKPLISVIVPVYKVENYLRKCVDSLLAQTYPNLEIILVDDGSPDNCPQLCDSLATTYSSVVALHKENGGLGSARNFGVNFANGEWVAFVDSDDYVLPNYIENMWQLQQKFSADLVCCGITQVDENDHILSKNVSNYVISMDGRDAFAAIYFYGKSGWRSYSKLMKLKIVKKYPFPEGYFEDFATSYKYFKDCQNIVISSNGDNYRYVQREGSILNSKLTRNHLRAFKICDTIADYVKMNYPEFTNLIYILYLRQVIQILNKQLMTKNEFRMIFKRYQGLFRRNFVRTLQDQNISLKTKIYMASLCTVPIVYRGVRTIAKAI